MRKKLDRIFNTVTFICISLICVIGLGFGLKASGITRENFITKLFSHAGNVEDEGPVRNKTLKENGDGTYKLSLSVVGDSVKQPNKANVVVVFDTSSSMNTDTGAGAVTYTPTTSTSTGLYGLIDGEYVPLERGGYSGNRTFWYNGVQYTGQRYTRQQAAQSRLAAAKEAVNTLAESLLSNNGNGNAADTIEIALVDFANMAEIAHQPTTDLASFQDAVNDRDAGNNNRGTNWEAGLRKVLDVDFGDEDPTYVIFVSDGNPTFYLNNNGTRGGSGQETTSNINTSYNQALPAAQAIVSAGHTFYTIGIYGNVDRMEDLTTYSGTPIANYFTAANTAALQEALNTILQKIEMAGIGNVEIIDGTTSKVVTSTGVANLLTIDESSFEYYKGGSVWEDAPEAKVVDGSVIWDLGDDVLDNGVEYKVTFNVWPSQETLDLIADLKNGVIEYDELDENIQAYLGEDYKLSTNTTAILKYADTRISDTVKEVTIGNPNPVKTDSYQLEVEKKWQNNLDGKSSEMMGEVVIGVNKDGVEVDTIRMNTIYNGWEGSTYIAPGIITKNGNKVEILETGHDYSLTESGYLTYHWELISKVVHPMIINGETTVLIQTDEVTISEGNYLEKDGKEYYKIGDKVYVSGDASEALTATNYRRSYFEFNKVVEGEDAPADAKFNYEFVVNDAEGEDIWFSIYDGSTPVIDVETNATAEMKDGQKTGSYYIASGETIEVTMEAGWNLRVMNLQIGSDYTVSEVGMDRGFIFKSATGEGTVENQTVSGTISEADKAYSVTFTNEYVLTNVEVTKIWEDNKNQDGLRPEEVEVEVYDGETLKRSAKVTGALTDEEWTYTFTGLDKYRDNKLIEYTVVEKTKVDGYESVVDGYTITNTHTIAKDDVTVTKVWDDNANQDVIRPASVQLQLYANDVAVGEPVVVEGSLTARSWTYTFDNLDVNKGGKPIVYTVKEVGKVTGYETKAEGLVVTNTHTPETVSVSVKKAWDDNNNQDGKRPASVTAVLNTGEEFVLDAEHDWTATKSGLPRYRNNNGTKEEIKYTWSEKEVGNDYILTGNELDKDDNTLTIITNTRAIDTTQATIKKVWEDDSNRDGARPESLKVYLNGKEYNLTGEGNEWTLTVPDLPLNEGGKPITYTWREETVTGYTASQPVVEGTITTITNSKANETTEVVATKKWEDKSNQDGVRPGSVKLQLYANDKKVGDPVIVTGEGNEWTYSFGKLNKNENGKPITYRVEEIGELADGYTSEAEGLVVTNTRKTSTISISGQKIWNDAGNQDGARPDSITINLLADGKKVDSTTVTEDEEHNWKYTFADVDEYSAGKKIVYTVTEDEVPGYEPVVTGYNITNNHKLETTSVTVKKVWNDNSNQDGVRPKSVTIKLFANGEKVREELVTGEGDEWSYTFEGLDANSNGKPIVYTVEEKAVDGYEPSVEGYTITNSHTPATTSIEGVKRWNDNNNQDGKRPTSVTIKLLANGEVYKTAEATAKDGWAYKFENLPVNKAGKAIEYTLSEEAVTGYRMSVDGTDVVNTHELETTDVITEKVWEDTNNNDRVRPENITIRLLADGEEIDYQVVTANDNWSAKFEGLPKYNEGKEIAYTITEDKVDGYTSKVEGYKVTNTHALNTRTFTVSKVWADKDNQDGKRPESVTVRLYADGTAVEGKVATLSEENKWTYTFEDLQELTAGEAIVYTVVEDDIGVEGYSATYKDGVVTNTYDPETTTVTVTKTWEDATNQDGIRPDKITVQLFANDDAEPVKEAEITAEDGWTYTFEGLDANRAGEPITYSVKEVPVEGYESVVDGYTITNTHTPETVDVNGTIDWDDEDDKDEIRPDDVEICVYANGEKVDCTTVTEDENGNWVYGFEDLPKNNDGEEIVYTVVENPIDEYEINSDGRNFINKHEPEEGEILGQQEEPTVEGENDNPETGDTILPYALLMLASLGGISITAKKIVDKRN